MYTSARVVYTYRDNITITVEELNEKLFQLHIPALCFVVVSMVVGIIGNALVLLIYKAKFRRSNHRYFILFLAIVDMLACVTGLPFLVASLRLPYLMTSAIACKTLRYFHYWANNCSGLLLLVISIERFRKICRPFKKQLTNRQTLHLCVTTLVTSAIIAIPAPIIFGMSTIDTGIDNITGTECYIEDYLKDSLWVEGYISFLMLETLVCIIIFAILYTFIIRVVWKTDNFVSSLKSMKITSMDSCHGESSSVDGLDESRDTLDDVKINGIKGTVNSGFTGTSSDDNSTKRRIGLGRNGHCKTDVATDSAASSDWSNSEQATQSAAGRSVENEDKADQCDVVGDDGKKPPAFKRSASTPSILKVKDPNVHRLRAMTQVKQRNTIVTKHLAKEAVNYQKKMKRKSKSTARVTIMLFAVSIIFAVAFVPHLVLMMVTVGDDGFLDSLNATEVVLYQLFLRIFIINNIMNPIVYILCDSKFRKECGSLWRRVCPCARK